MRLADVVQSPGDRCRRPHRSAQAAGLHHLVEIEHDPLDICQMPFQLEPGPARNTQRVFSQAFLDHHQTGWLRIGDRVDEGRRARIPPTHRAVATEATVGEQHDARADVVRLRVHPPAAELAKVVEPPHATALLNQVAQLPSGGDRAQLTSGRRLGGAWGRTAQIPPGELQVQLIGDPDERRDVDVVARQVGRGVKQPDKVHLPKDRVGRRDTSTAVSRS